MSKALSEAIQKLADVSAAQLAVMRAQEARARRAEFERPDFQAELAAKRKPLRKFSAAAFIRAAPEVFAQFNAIVPVDFYSQYDENTIMVDCPCGEQHGLGTRGYPVGGACGRYFLYDGENVRVALGPSTARQES